MVKLGSENVLNNMELHCLEDCIKSVKPNTTEEPAVLVRNAYKYYGFKKDPLKVLDGFNMTVPKGVIYALLGASGCGKTTLLGCILGQKKLNSGEIQVLGKMQGIKENVCGVQIGYMPQEIGLYGDFTIKETLLYFGWITGMKRDEIKEKAETLMKTFLMPETEQRVKMLSGGEQRRVSLISALLHDPQLLILDEPTAGVDPLLRENIWKYLKHLTNEKGITVIITTHYIEETRQADITALMRGGKLLAEESPDKLLVQYESRTLEEIFLKLSRRQSEVDQSFGNIQNLDASNNCNNSNQRISITTVEDDRGPHLLTKRRCNFDITDCTSGVKLVHMKALIWKNALWWRRNIPVLLYTSCLTTAALILLWYSIGGDPHDLPLAVINYEMNNTANCDYTLTCNSTQLSCNYLERIRNRSFVLMDYNSEEDAKWSTLHGDIYGYIVIPHNYSAALRARFDDYSSSRNIRFSFIDVIRDNSNIVISYYLKRAFYEEFQHFVKDYFGMCDVNTKIFDLPINWKKTIFESNVPSYTSFTFPGMLILFTFLQGVYTTAGTMLVERKEASLERTFVLGITEVELLVGHIICEIVVVIIQAVLLIIVTYVIFEIAHLGSITLTLSLVTLTGFCGMCFGLLISIICDTQIMITLAASAVFFPGFYFCGVLWPLEGMNKILRAFTPLHPVTNSILGLRAVLYKNSNLLDEEVYLGFTIMSVWSVIFLIASLIWLKINK